VLGYEATNFTDVFRSSSFFGTIGPSVRWDILNYGRLVNGIRVQDAVFQTRVLDYQNVRPSRGPRGGRRHCPLPAFATQTRNLFDSATEAKIAAEDG